MSNRTINQLFNFQNKTVIVTGGSMGIGFGIVKRFVEAGANVIIADIAPEGQVKAKELGSKVMFVKTDVSLEKDVKNLVSQTIKKFGTVDVLINNAGIFPQVPVLDMTLDFWEKTQDVNLRGVFLCSKETGQVMVKKGQGNIINIASIDSLHPSMIGLAAYDASKHGVWGFTKNFALEVAKNGVRVNAIAPGGISTEGVAKMNQGIKGVDMKKVMKEFTTKIPLGRFGEPDEIATVALFLASDASKYITGEIVVVDGGFLLT